ncbi:hypothetical protein BH10PSE19_BH10PSE19_13210 [soil metagenome]
MKLPTKNSYLTTALILSAAVTTGYLPVSLANPCSTMTLTVQNRSYVTLKRTHENVKDGTIVDLGAVELNGYNGNTIIKITDEPLHGVTMSATYEGKSPYGPLSITINAAENPCYFKIGALDPYPSATSNLKNYAIQVSVTPGSYSKKIPNKVEYTIYETVPSK